MSTEKGVDYGTNTHKSEKIKVSLSIDKNVIEKCHALGINCSKASENMLKELINAIENRNSQNKQAPFLTGVLSGERKPKELGMGIEPTYNSSAGCRLSPSATPAEISSAGFPHKNIEGSVFSGCYFNSITML